MALDFSSPQDLLNSLGDAYSGPNILDATIDNVNDTQSNQYSMRNGSTAYYATNRIFGSPYGFIPSVDPSFDVYGYLGEYYTNQVVMNSNILTMKIGRTKYTAKESAENVNNIIATGIATDSSADEIGDMIISSIVGKMLKTNVPMRYYSFYGQHYEYIKYVTFMCTSIICYLGIEDFYIPILTSGFNGEGKTNWTFVKIKNFDWSVYATQGVEVTNKVTNMISQIGRIRERLSASTGNTIADNVRDAVTALPDFINGSLLNILKTNKKAADTAASKTTTEGMNTAYPMIQFMIEPTTIGNTFNSSTKESMITSALRATDQIGTEVGWLLGANRGNGLLGAAGDLVKDGVGKAVDIMNGLVTDIPIAGQILGPGIQALSRGILGEKMVFPKIYESSSYHNQVNFEMVCNTPYGNKYSYFIDCCLPVIFLICAAAPHTTSANSYASPFLIQSYIPGQYSCTLGIISNLSITRPADQNKVNCDGLPLSIRVTFSIEDLYSNITASTYDDLGAFYSNKTTIEYLASFSSAEIWNIGSNDVYLNKLKNVLADKFTTKFNANVTEGIADWINSQSSVLFPVNTMQSIYSNDSD